MKANHNLLNSFNPSGLVVVNISSSKNESKSQQGVTSLEGFLSCCKYQ